MSVKKENETILAAFIEDKSDIELAKEVFKTLNLDKCEVLKGGIKEALTVFSKKRSPPYLLIDISKSELPISDLNRLLEVCDPAVKIIALGEKNDVGIYRDLMRLGIFEYIVKPLFPEILSQPLQNMVIGEVRGKEGQSKRGKMIAVLGSRGGVGSSFIATNFAAILSQEWSRKVVIVDLDLHFGTVALNLNLKPTVGLKEIIEQPERIDQGFIERIIKPVNNRLFMVSGEESLDEDLKYKIEGIEKLLDYLSNEFHYIVTDVPHFSNSITQSIVKNAHMVILVTDSSLAGLRDTGRLIRFIGKESADRRIVVVINKYGECKENEIKISDFEESVKHKVNHVISYNSSVPMDCINQGKTLASEDIPLASSLREIVENVVGVRAPEMESVSGLSSFLKKLKLK